MTSRHRWLLLFLVLGAVTARAQAGNPRANFLLSLTRADSGKRFGATLGQIIQVDLQTLTLAGYGLPQITSPAIQFCNSALLMPPNPGGPMPVYLFEAVAPGEAQIQIKSDRNPTFEVRVEVSPSTANRKTFLTPDQSNTNETGSGWTNLSNSVRQTFIPGFRKLVKVEVNLALANPDSVDRSLTMVVLNPQGEALADTMKSISTPDAGWVGFLLPNGGLDLTPGQTYSIRLEGSALFGWKYVPGGYERGEAWFNDMPLLNTARSSFLFRTFAGS